LYYLKTFLRTQDEILKENENKLKESFDLILKHIMDTYELFILQKETIQIRWVKHIKKLDHKLQSALITSVKNTLLDLSKHIKGEK